MKESRTGLGRIPERLYVQIALQLYEHIGEAGLGPGDRLPPERELAARLQLSRASLAQALVPWRSSASSRSP